MKGIIFRELLDLIENQFGDEVLDTVIESSKLESKGAYTSIGTYHYSEIIELVKNLSAETNITTSTLLVEFGKYLFSRFAIIYPYMFKHTHDTFSFLSEIQGNIHIQVKKLYPEAQVPKIDTNIHNNEMELIYTSERKMHDLAEGLILGCLDHFSEKAHIEKRTINKDNTKVRFLINKTNGK